MEFIDLFYKGGNIMWVILFALVVVLAIMLERAFFYFFNSYPYEKYEKYLKQELEQKNIAKVSAAWEIGKVGWLRRFKRTMSLFRLKNSVIYKIADVYLRSIGYPQEAMHAALNRKSAELMPLQEKYLRMLSLIGQVSPLLGLLGTVTGMIKAFFVIASLGGQVDVTKLAGGISEAMITTAFGLIVAIPAYIAYEMYQKVVDNRVEKINRMVSLLDEFYHREKPVINQDFVERNIEDGFINDDAKVLKSEVEEKVGTNS